MKFLTEKEINDFCDFADAKIKRKDTGRSLKIISKSLFRPHCIGLSTPSLGTNKSCLSIFYKTGIISLDWFRFILCKTYAKLVVLLIFGGRCARINFNMNFRLILKQRFSIRPFMRSKSIADMLINQTDMACWSKNV